MRAHPHTYPENVREPDERLREISDEIEMKRW